MKNGTKTKNYSKSVAKILCVVAMNKATEAAAAKSPMSDSAMVAAADAVDVYIAVSVGDRPKSDIGYAVDRALDSLEYSCGRDGAAEVFSALIEEVPSDMGVIH